MERIVGKRGWEREISGERTADELFGFMEWEGDQLRDRDKAAHFPPIHFRRKGWVMAEK